MRSRSKSGNILTKNVVLCAALRHGEHNFRALALGKPILQKLRFPDGKGQQDLARQEGRSVVVLLQKCRKQHLVGFLLAAREQEMELLTLSGPKSVATKTVSASIQLRLPFAAGRSNPPSDAGTNRLVTRSLLR